MKLYYATILTDRGKYTKKISGILLANTKKSVETYIKSRMPNSTITVVEIPEEKIDTFIKLPRWIR